MYNVRSRGFTLIELLVVIAIIGVLSAVVLASLNTARSKGNDAAIASNLNALRAQATLYYDENGSYGPAITASVSNDCATAGTVFADTNVIAQIAAAEDANGVALGVTCNIISDGTVASGYAVSAALMATAGEYFCVDSTGVAITTMTALAADSTCS